ncbi:MAG: VIT domain-containing protein, partial [Chloroflexota bacterium]
MYTELSVLPTLHLLDDLESPLPLEHTTVRACVTGLVGTVTVTQRFRNPLTSLADLEYLFPLPHAAAITALELLIGERTIRASVYEIQQARQEYAAARSQGRHASLLDGRRPNLFALQLANIQPGEFIQVVTSYQQRLELSAGSCEFVFPMGLTPKYHRPGQAA